MADGLTITGADRVASTLGQAAHALEDLSETNAKVAALVATQARSRAPRVSGRLATSITPQNAKQVASVGSDLVYAPVIHSGWPAHHIRANPFIANAFTDMDSQTAALYEQAAEHAADQVKGA